MITHAEAMQIAYEGQAPEGIEPKLLTRAELEAKLAELKISLTSPLGRHVLAGGRLWSRDGLFRLDTAGRETSERPAARSLIDHAADIYAGPATSLSAEPKASQNTPRKSVPARPAERTLVDYAADVYAGPEVEAPEADEDDDVLSQQGICL